MSGEPFSKDLAEAIWDILVGHAGAPESLRDDFLFHQTRQHMSEYRFQGRLGHGGKFWRNYGRIVQRNEAFLSATPAGERWYVTFYPEDEREGNPKALAEHATNKALHNLRLANMPWEVTDLEALDLGHPTPVVARFDTEQQARAWIQRQGAAAELTERVGPRFALEENHRETAREKVMQDYGDQPGLYEENPHTLDRDTAQVWVAHVHVHDPAAAPAMLRRAALYSVTTGEYGWGDSFVEWGEPPHDERDNHLAIYYSAQRGGAYNVGNLIATGAFMAAMRELQTDVENVGDVMFAISAAGDFAEQIES